MSQESGFFWEKQDIDWEEIFKRIEKQDGKIKVLNIAEYLESNLDEGLFKSQYLHLIIRAIESGILQMDGNHQDIRKNKVSLSKDKKEGELSTGNIKQANFSEF